MSKSAANEMGLLGPIYTVRFLSHATSLRQAYDMTYDWCVRQKNVVAF